MRRMGEKVKDLKIVRATLCQHLDQTHRHRVTFPLRQTIRPPSWSANNAIAPHNPNLHRHSSSAKSSSSASPCRSLALQPPPTQSAHPNPKVLLALCQRRPPPCQLASAGQPRRRLPAPHRRPSPPIGPSRRRSTSSPTTMTIRCPTLASADSSGHRVAAAAAALSGLSLASLTRHLPDRRDSNGSSKTGLTTKQHTTATKNRTWTISAYLVTITTTTKITTTKTRTTPMEIRMGSTDTERQVLSSEGCFGGALVCLCFRRDTK
ncbi:hypothetical protein IWX47DRAFT_81410 [Phyllosticta citricarpa]